MDESSALRGKSRDRAISRAVGAAMLSRLVSALVTIATFAIAARTLSSPELGVVAVLTTIGVFLSSGDFGLGMLLMSRLPEANSRGDIEEMRSITGITLVTLGGLGVLIAVAGSISAYVLPWPSLLGAEALPSAEVRLAVVCFFVSGGLSIPATVIVWVLSAMLRASIVHLWTAASAVVTLALVVLCAALDLPMWSYVAAVLGVPTALGMVQTVWAFNRLFPHLRPTTLRVSVGLARGLLRDSAPYAVINMMGLVSYAIDSLVISSILGPTKAATFALVARMFTLVGSTLILAGQQMWSALVDAIHRGDDAWVRSRFKRSVQVSAAVSAGGCTVVVIVAQPVVRLWLGDTYVPPLSFVLLLAVWTVYYPMVQQASYLVVAMGRVGALARAGAIAAPVNLALSIWLTNALGLTGPILGNIAAYSATTLVPIVYFSSRYLRQTAPAGEPSQAVLRQ
jgi:O-antigen/teichoic acid export membrane protein